MFYSGVNPKMTNALKQWRKKQEKKEDPTNKKLFLSLLGMYIDVPIALKKSP